MEKELTLVKANILPFGASKSGKDLVISVPMTEEIDEICLIDKNSKGIKGSAGITDDFRNGDIYSFKVKNGAGYNYILKNKGKKVRNPYARVVCGSGEFGKCEEIVYGTYRDNFKWDDVEYKHKYDESFIYRLHVRGFTKHPSSKVRNKGTFAGIVEKIDYLKKLSVTAVELMPAYEFEEIIESSQTEDELYVKACVDEKDAKVNFWGYGKSHYFAPKESYSSKKNGGQVNEFKYMVNELHKAGIEVIMDFYFVPKTNPYLIMDCLRHWVLEYHIDGIHVNMEVAPAQLIKEDPVLSTVKILADSWDMMNWFNDKAFSVNRNKRLAISNDDFMINVRRFIKSDEGQVAGIIENLKRNPANCGIINYVANHNSFTLMDAVSYDKKHNELNGENNNDGTSYNYSWNCGFEGDTRKKKIKELRRKQIKNALTLLFLSQGTPMIYAGDEMGKSQQGNNNPYCQDNETTWINWNLLNTNKDIFEYVIKLVELRNSHKILRMETEPKNIDYLQTGAPDISFHGTLPWKVDATYGSRELGVLYNGAYGEKETDIYVAINMYWESVDFNVPNISGKTKWKVSLVTEKNIEEITFADRKITIPGRCIVVLESERKDVTK